MQIKTYTLDTRLAGTRHQYFILKFFLDGKLIDIHTSKDENYINRLITERS